MKRLFLALMATILLFSISTSCTKQDLNDENQPALTEPDESTNPNTPPEEPGDNGEG